MEITPYLVNALGGPEYVLKHDDIEKRVRQSEKGDEVSVWSGSPLNPKNRPDTLEPYADGGWRIDGATMNGRQFYAIPPIPELVPLRIDVFVTDQDPPRSLRACLDMGLATIRRHPQQLMSLGLPRFLCRALNDYTRRNPAFFDRYSSLPFGSQLHINRLPPSPGDVEIEVIRNDALEKRSQPLACLQESWKQEVPLNDFPDTIELEEMRLVKQIHDSVSLVQIPGRYGAREWIFKTNMHAFDHLYHELRFLLSCPPHPNMMPRPRHIVTKKVRFGGKRGVVGFILRYFPLGSIRDMLPRLASCGGLDMRARLALSKQVLSALLHIQREAKTFYSDLRPDNVLVSRCADGNWQAIVCDFEQRGNWFEWCPPEILYPQYLEEVRRGLLQFPSSHWESVVGGWERLGKDLYMSPDKVKALNAPWLRLSCAQRERAHVFCFGLFLYSVFEGLSNVRISLWNSFLTDPDVEFPEFKRTPPAMREIICRCTVDAPGPRRDDGAAGAQAIVRRGDRITVEIAGNPDADTSQSPSDVLSAGYQWWSAQLETARRFLESDEFVQGLTGAGRPTLDELMQALEDLDPEALLI